MRFGVREKIAKGHELTQLLFSILKKKKKWSIEEQAIHSRLLRISSVNVTKTAGNCRSGDIY